MGLLQDMDQQVKKFDLIDVNLVQATAMFLALIIAKAIPCIMDVSIWWFIGLDIYDGRGAR
ncbi:MAG TPA: hypothetical protein VMW16_05370 [Sedimentisphaerales bacterium]|nr:hypothetical protein [Sedimentisphaerales bacterium]